MSDENDSGDKQHEPSQKKLDDAREKGEIAKATDLLTAAGYAGFLSAALTIGKSTCIATAGALARLLDQPDRIALTLFGGDGLIWTAQLLLGSILPLSPYFLMPMALVLTTLFATRTLVFATEKLKPQISRISPLSNLKNKFDRAGIFEFLKSFVKLLIYAITLFLFLKGRLPQLMQTMAFEPAISTSIMLRTTLDFVAVVLMISVAIGGIDYIWQVSNHRRKNRMSRQEMTDESKMSDGDPHMKQQRRQRGYDLAMNHMLAEVPKADVVIVNPTHYAVALSWRRERHTAPECVAKGVDELAARIRQAAMEAGVPIHSDPATARGLYATVELGDQIDPRYYRAVASAIRFAESMRKRARERSGR